MGESLRWVRKTPYTCIYCKQTKESDEFNREHVFHNSFGKYKNAFTLTKKVCKVCNQTFGDGIDEKLSRKTYEGMYRFYEGINSPKEFDFKKHGKCKSRVAQDGFMKGQGIDVFYDPEAKKIQCKPKGDVAFKKQDGTYDFYFISNLPTKGEFEEKYPLHCDQIKIVNLDKKDEISKELANYFGVSDYTLEDESFDINCGVEYAYGRDVFRAIAKIAFNYLAYFYSTETLLKNCFDPIRNFIYNGAGEWQNFIGVSKKPILPEKNGMAISGHIIISDIFPGGRVVARIALFNLLQYTVFLTSYESNMFIIPRGHLFDPHGHKIIKLDLAVSYNIFQGSPGSFEIIS